MLTLLMLACGPHVPPAPPLPIWSEPPSLDRFPDLTIRVAHLSTFEATRREVQAGGDGTPLRLFAEAIVVEHPVHGVVLIDAGYGCRSVGRPEVYPGRLLARLLDLDVTTCLVEELPAIGRGVADVRHIVLTHLHHDHAAGVEDFPDATLVVDAREWAAGARSSLIHGYAPDPYVGRKATTVSFAGTMPLGPFAEHVDLFGDGSVVLLPAPGHTVGSLAVLVQSSKGRLLYLGDAAWVDANWQGPVPKGAMARTLVEDDWRTGIAALHRFKAWAESDPGLVVVSGHDPSNLERFPWPDEVFP